MRTALTSKERIDRALKGQDVDYIPFSPFLAYVWESFPQHITRAGMPAFLESVGADPLWRGAPGPVHFVEPEYAVLKDEKPEKITTTWKTKAGSLTFAHTKSDNGNTWFLTEYPLKTEGDYKTLQWYFENSAWRVDPADMNNHLAGDGQTGLSIGMLPPVKSAFQKLIEHFSGTEELNYALIDFPGTVEALRQIMVQKHLEGVRLAAEHAVYEYFITWEDSSTQNYSPAQYDRYIGTEIAQWCSILKSFGKKYIQHACGHVDALVTRMKDTGVNAVESISPPPTGNITIKAARAKVGADFGIIGGIEPTAFLNLNIPDLREYTKQVLLDGSGGPFVLANSDSCPPGVTAEKFKAVAEVTRSG